MLEILIRHYVDKLFESILNAITTMWWFVFCKHEWKRSSKSYFDPLTVFLVRCNVCRAEKAIKISERYR